MHPKDACHEDAVEDDDEPVTTDSESSATRKGRSRNSIKVGTIKVTRLDFSGEPLSPLSAHSEYGNTIGCIVREVCNLNDPTIRGKENAEKCDLLLKRLHQRFSFPRPYNNLKQTGNLVNEHALCKFSKALSGWKYMARTDFLEKGKEFAVVRATWPSVSEEDWEIFIENLKNSKSKALSKWGKDQSNRCIGRHTLGTRGYGLSKKQKWRNEDAEMEKNEEPNH